ncbi:MAG: nickel-dependent hydrogenase large subunit [Thermodesulfobacteriota bacterium]
MGKIVIDPITRIEGHLKIECLVENGVIKEARSSGMLFRGFEIILQGRDPRDAQIITQRICGVCNLCHAMASTLNLDSAFGLADKIPDNGRIMRNLAAGLHVVQDHILHFYHLAALDYVDVTKVAKYAGHDPDLKSIQAFIGRGELGPFVPRYEGDYRLPDEVDRAAVSHYVKALEMRRKGHEAVAMLTGRIPHTAAIVPGGMAEVPTVDKIASLLWRLNELRSFIDNVYIPDVLAVAEAYSDYFQIGAGCKNYLSYGAYDLEGDNPDYTKRKRLFQQGTVSADLKLRPLDLGKITEEVRHSWYADETSGLHPGQGKTMPTGGKKNGYSWLKAPRYEGQVYEVGPLAQILTTYAGGNPQVRALVDNVLGHFKAEPPALFSVLGRHAARALSAKYIADSMGEWLLQLKPGEPAFIPYEIPEEAYGVGIIDAARGALGHWMEIKDKKIANYQCVVPTTWNASPRDDSDTPGPIEQALIGTRVKDEQNPFEIVRIVRSFDPCMACAVHMLTPKGSELGRFRIF